MGSTGRSALVGAGAGLALAALGTAALLTFRRRTAISTFPVDELTAVGTPLTAMGAEA